MANLKGEVLWLVHQLKHQGWRIRQGKHFKAYPLDKTKPPVSISFTPSDVNAVRNMKRELKKSGAIID